MVQNQDSDKSGSQVVAPYRNWDDCYKKGKDSLPWDTGEAAPELVRYLESVELFPGNVLEIGCGTGTNAVWMARRGASVVATDISPKAVEIAKTKQNEASVSIDFRVADIIVESPVADASVDFVFDRGVYHVMQTPEFRKTFIDRVAAALKDGGFWLCVSGSADEQRAEGEEGPPQLKASDLVDLAEEKFELFSLQRILSVGPHNRPPIVMWEALYRKR